MGDRLPSVTFDDLPVHLILEILTSGCRLSGVDLVSLELTNSSFRFTHDEFVPQSSKSLVDFAAFQVCKSHPVYVCLSQRAQEELVNRCVQNWKRVLRFLQSVYQCSDVVQTTSGNVCFLILFAVVLVFI